MEELLYGGSLPHQCSRPRIAKQYKQDNKTGASYLRIEWNCAGEKERGVTFYELEMRAKSG
jgi:hypothetical protein